MWGDCSGAGWWVGMPVIERQLLITKALLVALYKQLVAPERCLWWPRRELTRVLLLLPLVRKTFKHTVLTSVLNIPLIPPIPPAGTE